MTSGLVNLYAANVIEGKRTIESVPEKFRDEVRKIVEEVEKAEKAIDM